MRCGTRIKTMKDRIEELGEIVASKIPALFAEAHDQIQAAIDAAMEDAHDAQEAGREAKTILRIPVGIAWDLDGSNVVIRVGVTVRKTYEQTAKFEDTNQPTLPLRDGDGDAMPESAAKAVREIAKTLRDHGATVTMLNGGAR